MESEAVNSALRKQLQAMEEVMKSKNETQEQLQTKIDGLTKTVDSINQAVHSLFEKQEQTQTKIDGLKNTVESMNHMSQAGCETPKDVCRSLLDAAQSGDVDSAKKLVKCDSNDSCTTDDKYRNTPLILAAKNGHVEVVRVLLEGGADVDRANAYGTTALHLAGGYGRLDVCRLLLDWGANVDHLNRWNDTPLYYAARWGHLSEVKLLVERGADISVKGYGDQTASEVARFEGHEDVADWLDWVTRG